MVFSTQPHNVQTRELALASEPALDSASALEAEGRLIRGSGEAIAPPVIAERAIARDLGPIGSPGTDWVPRGPMNTVFAPRHGLGFRSFR